VCVCVRVCVYTPYHASLCSEDDDLVERCELLEQVVDARSFLKAPTCRQLETKQQQQKCIKENQSEETQERSILSGCVKLILRHLRH